MENKIRHHKKQISFMILILFLCAALAFAAGVPPQSFIDNSAFRSKDKQFHNFNYYPTNPQTLPKAASVYATQRALSGGLIWHNLKIETESGPLTINIIEADLNRNEIAVKAALAEDRVNNNGETVSAMVKRTNAIAGINGDFFISATAKEPAGMTVIEGRILKLPTDLPAIGFNKKNKPTIGFWKNISNISFPEGKFPLSAVNYSSPKAESLVVYTSAYDIETPFINEKTAAAILKKDEKVADRYVVSGTLEPGNSIGIEPDAPVLVAIGEKSVEWLKANINSGLGVMLNLNADGEIFMNTIENAIGGGAILVKDGTNVFAAIENKSAAPKEKKGALSAIGYIKKSKKLLMVAIDGGNPALSIGVNGAQAAELMKSFNCTDALSLQGGDYSALAGKIPETNSISLLNSPAQGGEIPTANALLIYNTSKPSKPVSLEFSPDEINALINTKFPAAVTRWDEFGNSSEIKTKEIFTKTIPPTLGDIKDEFFLTGNKAGDGKMIIKYNKFKKEIKINIFDSCDSLDTSPKSAHIENGDTLHFAVRGFSKDGKEIKLFPENIDLSSEPNIGEFHGADTFVAKTDSPQSGRIRISAGGQTAFIPVTVNGNNKTILKIDNPAVFKIETFDEGVSGDFSLSTTNLFPNSQSSGKLNYDFTKSQKSSSAISLVCDVPVNGEPIRIGINILGDKSENVVKIIYADANGNESAAYLSTQIDWKDWKFISAKIPAGTKYPIRIKNIILINSGDENKKQGEIYLGDFEGVYPLTIK